MSKESALLFLKKMQEDLKFRNYIENLGLDEQEKAAKNSGFIFTLEEFVAAIEENTDPLKNVHGGSHVLPDEDYNGQYASKMKDILNGKVN